MGIHLFRSVSFMPEPFSIIPLFCSNSASSFFSFHVATPKFLLCIPVWGTANPEQAFLSPLSDYPQLHLNTSSLASRQHKLPFFSTFESICSSKSLLRIPWPAGYLLIILSQMCKLCACPTSNTLLFLPHPFIISYPTSSVQVFAFITTGFDFCPSLFHSATLFTVALPITFNDSQICHFLPHYLFSQSASPLHWLYVSV